MPPALGSASARPPDRSGGRKPAFGERARVRPVALDAREARDV